MVASFNGILLSNKKINYLQPQSSSHITWMKPMNTFAEQENSRVHTLWFHLYEILEHKELTFTKKKNPFSGYHKQRERREWLGRSIQEFARVQVWFYSLLVIDPTAALKIPFSRGSSWPRDQTQVSWIAGRFFTIWATPGSPGVTQTHQFVTIKPTSQDVCISL